MSQLSQRLRLFSQVDIYPVTSERCSKGRTSLEILDAVIDGGARIVQLREKEATKRQLFELAQAFRRRTRQAGLLLMINDHLDIALAVEADGVHLGQEDLPIAAAKKLAPELIIGASTHSLEQAIAVQKAGADTLNIGPIFPTQTKGISASGALGVAGLSQVAPHVEIPYSVMGGITADNVAEVLDAGATKVAVVTAITKAPDPAQATAELARIVRGCS